MRFQLSTLIGTIIVISGASILGRVVKVISLDNPQSSNQDNVFGRGDLGKKMKSDVPLTIENKSDHLIWFIQVSDIHLSIFHDEDRITSFEKFVNETLSIVKPSAVLASGDLTDAKTVDMLGSKQYLKEWTYYSDALRKARVWEKTVWLDIRGNHDNFDVPALSSSNNFYQKYSIQGPNHQRSYMYSLKKGFDSVSFIAVDACLLPGPRRPFNFIGVLTSKEMNALEAFEKESRKHNFTIWFGHYPTSCIISPNPGIRALMRGGLAYLCGHLHTLGGFARNLYTRQQAGYLELELGDWKDERLFRVAVIDHGLFSFVDVPLDDWPIILVSNPKSAMFVASRNEPSHLLFHSTHIRVLVWSSSRITQVRVRIRGKGKWHLMTHVKGPLYVAHWKPNKYSEGIHTLEVFAQDVFGRKKTISQPFSLDNSETGFSFWSRAILMSNISVLFQFLFGVTLGLCVLPLCAIRWIHVRVKDKKMARPRPQSRMFRSLLRKLWVLASVDGLFWPLLLYLIYLPIGPWFIGEVLDGHVGVVFAWGTFVYRSYLPGSLTYAYGFLQTLVFQCPLILLSAHSADVRFQYFYMNEGETFFQLMWRQMSYFCLIAMQAMNAYFFWLAYGTLAFVLGPLRTWSVLLGTYTWFRTWKLSKDDLRSVGRIWSSNSPAVIETDFDFGRTNNLVQRLSSPTEPNPEGKKNEDCGASDSKPSQSSL